MTENKRFIFDGRDCFDNGEFWLDLSLPTYSNVKEICKMLNELNDENKELKAENKELRLLVDTFKEQNMKFKLRLKDLGVEYLD